MVIKLLSYAEWLEANPEYKGLTEECHQCGGTGECTCDCGDEHSCGECYGEGKIDISMEEYNKQINYDIAKLTKAGEAFIDPRKIKANVLQKKA